MAFPQVEIKDYEERPNIFAIRLPSGRWHDFDRATLAGEWAWYYHLAKCDNHVTEALQVQIQNAVDGLNELDGIIPFTEALGKGEATEYDTELAYLVGEAQRLGFDYEARAGFEKWATEKAQAEMSLDEAIGVRNMVEMNFDAYAGPNPSWGDDQALIDYRENMPALLGAFAALLMHCRAAVAASARPTAPAATAEAWVSSYAAPDGEGWISVAERLPTLSQYPAKGNPYWSADMEVAVQAHRSVPFKIVQAAYNPTYSPGWSKGSGKSLHDVKFWRPTFPTLPTA